MNYLHSYHTVTDTGKNQRAKIFDSHAIGTNPRLQAGKTSVLARVKMPAGSNSGPP